MTSSDHHHRPFRGPRAWAVAAVAGALAGGLIALVVPRQSSVHPHIALWMVIPFITLLACIALLPLTRPRFWHRHYPDVSLFLGAMVAAFYVVAFRTAGPGHSMPFGAEHVLHAFKEYYAFIAVVGGLYLVSGGVLVEVRGRGTPLANVCILGTGAVLANIVGTTGASMLLIRPFMRLNEGRLSPLHIVFFIIIVSNCGGCLTPIGDPPLYLGFLKGVPFEWTLIHLWLNWAVVVGALLAVFFFVDRRFGRPAEVAGQQRPGVSVRGRTGLICLVLMLVGAFIPPMLKSVPILDGLLVGATFQLAVALASYILAPRDILKANEFTFEPVKEVGLLFAGIFLTMIPALGYLAANSASFGLKSAVGYYFATGSLSAILDNAPTYLSFLQVALAPEAMNAAGVARFLASPGGTDTLVAISTSAVFFGAMTYIGNGPNFMVKAIAEASGVRMPGFFRYLGMACLILLPILVLHALVLVR